MADSKILLKDLIKNAIESSQIVDDKLFITILKEATKYATSSMDLSPEDLFSNINFILEQMKNWLKDFNNKKMLFEKRRLLNYNSVAKKMSKAVDKVTKNDFTKYYKEIKSNRNLKDYEKYKEDLLQSYLNGFMLWESFRIYMTNQAINYSILYADHSVLYEAREITLLELLERGQFQLSYDKTKAGNISYGIVFKVLSMKEEEMFPGTAFYNQLINKFYSNSIDRGAIYETYEEIRQTFVDFPINRGVSEKWFKNMNDWLEEHMYDNMRDWSSGRKIGDQGLSQLKNISVNTAHLSAIQSLPADISNVIKAFQFLQGNELVKTLTKLLTVDIESNSNKLSANSAYFNKKAQEAIKNNLDKI